MKTYDGDLEEKPGGVQGFVQPLCLVHEEDLVTVPGHQREDEEEKYSNQ